MTAPTTIRRVPMDPNTCRACGFAIECVECGLQMSAHHDCAAEIASMA